MWTPWPLTSQPPELRIINFYCLSDPVYSIFLWQPEQTNTLSAFYWFCTVHTFRKTQKDWSIFQLWVNKGELPRSLCFPGGSVVKNPSANAGDVGLICRWGNTQKKEMTTHSSILTWKIPRTEEPGGLQSAGSQKSRTWFNDWEWAYQDHRLPNLSLLLWWCLKNFLWVHRIKITSIK